ncbi:hypothetical protein LJC56_03530 [Christensenellaceae bacterium OttesenSCG-928-K19]|nr:hypothetical protein [Christensenellaceae bacterium OttesenSCG-928-K19]
MNKKLGLAVITVLLCLLLIGCSEAVYIKAGDTSYEITGVRIEDEYAEEASPPGYQFLLVQAKSSHADMELMEQTFFPLEGTRPTVYDGTDTVTCKSVTYAAEGSSQSPDITAILLFQVPVLFGEQFTLTGEAFGSVSLTSSQSAMDSIKEVFQGSN